MARRSRRPDRAARRSPGPQRRKNLAHGPAEELALACYLTVSVVHVLEAVLGTREHSGEARHLLEHPLLAFAFLCQPPLGANLLGDLDAGAEEASNRTILAAHRRVGEDEVRLLRVSLSLQDELDVVHVDRATGVSFFHHWQEVVAGLVPDLKEIATKGERVLVAEDLGVGAVVEERSVGSPGDEHRLV
jgi:hypothetical protein